MHGLMLAAVLFAAPSDFHARIRQPSALLLSADGARLYVAGGKSGSIVVVDAESARPISEHDVGRGLADLAPLPDGRRLLAVDRADRSLLLIEERDGALRVVARTPVAVDPVSLVVAADGRSCVAASRWSRALTFVDVSPSGLSANKTLELPFSPMKLTFVRGGSRLVVADAFGGGLAIVDPRGGRLESVRSIPGQNIRGLAESPGGETLVIALQTLKRLAHTSFEDIHWGSLVSNELLVLKLDELLAPEPGGDPLKGRRVIPLGDTGNGAGDPAAAAFASDGRFAVAMGGVDEVRVGDRPGRLSALARVGRRPTALTFTPDASTLFVANTLDDTFSVIDLPAGRLRATVSLGPRPEPTPAERGERLFYDARLSHDGWLSCHTCHGDGHTTGGGGDTLGDGGFGSPKQIPSLLGVGRTGPWGWLGGFERLEDQVRQSITSTMQGGRPTDSTISDLVAYLNTLEPLPPPSPSDPRAVARGRDVFDARKCAECHAPPSYTTPRTYDVRLADDAGNKRFNPPSLLGVGGREPLLHDGRAQTLEDVFGRHSHPRDSTFSPSEIADLSAFLRSL